MTKAVLVGSPNSGKSLLFNKLTGLNQKVGNFPGVTVDISSGKMLARPSIDLIDFPGVYSLNAISGEEEVAIDNLQTALKDDSLQTVICVLDSTRLCKALTFGLQILQACSEHNKPLIFAANMVDVLNQHKMKLDCEALSKALGTPVIPVSARNNLGLASLIDALDSATVPPPLGDDELISTDNKARFYQRHAQRLTEQFGPKGDVLIQTQARLDRFFLHSWTGGISFLLIMYLLFQSIFTWAAPAMDGVEFALESMSNLVLPLLPAGLARDFTADALFGGLGAFLVFVPQIFVLTFIVSILEDSGYLARAAVICHKPLRLFGLTGKSFVPMLSGIACAIPGIYAARTIDSPYKRWLTYMAIPLMPCSARLPVYTLLIAAFIPSQKLLGGLIGWQGLAMFCLYFFGMLCGLLVTALVSSTTSRQDSDLPFVLEMPPYRLPSWRSLLRHAWNRSKHFLTKAGTIIFSVTVIVWFLGYFPNNGALLADSWLGMLGHLIEPVFSPFGLDWKYGVAILASFLAREVFVGTLGTLFGIEGADETSLSLVENIQNSGLPVGAGLALMAFYAIALQCVSTLAVLKRETQSWRLPLQMFISYSLLAYASAWIIFTFAGLF